jgi:hypothetical protein
VTKPPIDVEQLADLSNASARSSTQPPAAHAAYERLVASLADLDAAGPGHASDAVKRAVLDQLASELGNI